MTEYNFDPSWWELRERFKGDEEELDKAFRREILPYEFKETHAYGDNNYTHWLILAPDRSKSDESMKVILAIGGHSREAEARNIALRISQACIDGWAAGSSYEKEKQEGARK